MFIKQDGFGWWRARLGAMANYFHAYRIDHILGFFRIWEMPASATGEPFIYFPHAHALTNTVHARFCVYTALPHIVLVRARGCFFVGACVYLCVFAFVCVYVCDHSFLQMFVHA